MDIQADPRNHQDVQYQRQRKAAGNDTNPGALAVQLGGKLAETVLGLGTKKVGRQEAYPFPAQVGSPLSMEGEEGAKDRCSLVGVAEEPVPYPVPKVPARPRIDAVVGRSYG